MTIKDHNFHKQLLDNTSTAICMVASNGHLSYLNPAGEHLFSRSARRLLGLPLKQVLDVSVERFWNAIAVSQPLVIRSTSARILTQPQELTCDISLTPIDGSTLIEISHRESQSNAEYGAATSERQHESLNLIKGLAHEIKNPLGGIRGAAQLLGKQLNEADLIDYTDIIVEESDRLRALVDRMMGPKHRPNMAAMNLHEVAERAARLAAHQYPNISIIRDYDPSLPDIQGDSNLLIQAALNLVNNAAQALESTPQSVITLRTRIRRKCVLNGHFTKLAVALSIIDNGPGICESQLERIFFPLVSGRADGTGLGLFISQSIAQAHRGVIEATSQSAHTEFSLLIAVEEPTQ